jgi:hypothetical protein
MYNYRNDTAAVATTRLSESEPTAHYRIEPEGRFYGYFIGYRMYAIHEHEQYENEAGRQRKQTSAKCRPLAHPYPPICEKKT